MFDYYDSQEWQPEQERERNLMIRLPSFLNYITEQSSYYRDHFGGIDINQIVDRSRLASLPLTHKSDLSQLQQLQPPLAGMVPAAHQPDRLFQSPGPICEPECTGDDWWGLGRAFYAAGFRRGDLVQNCLSYHMSPGGFILDSGARACGCTVIPAGPGNTEQQLDLIEQLKPQGYCGTPSFLKILLDKGDEQGRDLTSITKALVTGEAFTAPLQQRFTQAGLNVRQAYASADLGLIGYETVPNQGLVLAEDIIVEIVRPGTATPVGVGEVGEVVVTRFNPEYPLVRFATGDLSSILPGPSECGRTNVRIAGWQGRADQSTKVKGLFIHPQQLERLRQRFDDIALLRLIINSDNDNDQMQLQCELQTDESKLDTQTIASELKAITKLTGSVKLVPPRALARDGVVIEDRR
ncbi:phenylacetate--CoA ligase family protein [Ferrimonas lipolytica]|uniref:Phenylacetate--CoA ligase n=1 Tax=Ferrimonas lipolytica TaxID=2724191 RepID=A0A6H1UA80_9GAMM|nr:AMP-binding protein [Ferrimonas lipolytica]QIZ75957.1 phenylacetate--CoA ligase [Ferrimonas lipolytica]